MGLEKESTTMLRVPKCLIPERNWQVHQLSGMNLCTYKDGKNCPYRIEVLTLKTCEYKREEKSER